MSGLDELAAIVYGELDHIEADRVQAILTSDWLAARVAEADTHAIECERIGVEAIEARILAEHRLEQERAARLALVAKIKQAAVVAHKGPNDTDADFIRITARDLRGGYDVGGSNRRDAVARVLDVVAELLTADDTKATS